MGSRNDQLAGRLQRRRQLERVRSSLFVTPLLLSLGGVVLAVVTLLLDARVDPQALPAAFALAPESSRVLLSTIAGATITTAGVVFSITVLAVQLSTGQFTPRVTRRLFRDRAAQATVGLLMATFIYCVIVLSQVSGSAGGDETAPVLSTGVGLLLAVGVIVGIVAFLNHMARSLYVGNLIAGVTAETRHLIRDIAESGSDAAEERETGEQADAPPDEPGHVVLASEDGWVQQISGDALLAAVAPHTTVRLETRAGAFLVAGTPLATLWPAPEDADATSRALNESVVVADERTMQQDVDFGFRQLTDIALRALSPSLNDPTTAVEVVLRLGTLLRRQIGAPLTERQARGPEGRVLLRPYESDYGRLVRHAFAQIRHAAREHPLVLVAVVRTLRMLVGAAEHAGQEDVVAALEREIGLTVREAEESTLLPADVDEVRNAAREPDRVAVDPAAGRAVISDGL